MPHVTPPATFLWSYDVKTVLVRGLSRDLEKLNNRVTPVLQYSCDGNAYPCPFISNRIDVQRASSGRHIKHFFGSTVVKLHIKPN